MAVQRVVSGGQTGADRGGLEAADDLALSHGGWCPRGRRAEDGSIPARYGLRETSSPRYADRTERNVVDSDATVLVTFGPPAGGSALTAEFAKRHGRPLLHLDLCELAEAAAAATLRSWVAERGVHTLNVAGSRESKQPGIAAITRRVIAAALRTDS